MSYLIPEMISNFYIILISEQFRESLFFDFTDKIRFQQRSFQPISPKDNS